MEDRLRECICGKSAKVVKESGESFPMFNTAPPEDPWTVVCPDNNCPWQFGNYPTRKEAITAWNTRSTDPLMEKMVEAAESLLRGAVYNGYDFALKDEMEKVKQTLQEYRERKDAK